MSERNWTGEEVAARNKAGTALLTYARLKALLCDAALSQSVTLSCVEQNPEARILIQ